MRSLRLRGASTAMTQPGHANKPAKTDAREAQYSNSSNVVAAISDKSAAKSLILESARLGEYAV